MKTRITSILLTVCIFLQGKQSAAQNKYTLPQVTPQSPNAASLGKYGDVPVNLSTGMPSISVPLISAKVGSINIGVTLSYHYNGLKTDEIPSWAGLGWDIQAGGQINFEQRGNADFDDGMNGIFTSPTALTKLGRYLHNQMTPTEKYNYLEEVIDGNAIDAEFDLYHFSCMGMSGTFYFDSTQRIIQAPKSSLVITRNNSGLFTITDERGNQYEFGKAEQGTMGPAVLSGMETRRSFNESSSFLLSRILTAEGREIVFNYTQHPAAPQAMSYQKQSSQLVFYPTPAYSDCPAGSNFSQYSTAITVKNYLLQSIVFPSGSIQFELSNTGRADIQKLTGNAQQIIPYLKKVKLLNTQGDIVQEFTFNHSYFGDNDRLRLDEVVHSNGNPAATERWQFAYHGQNIPSFPSFFSKSKDHWGYYNGANNYTSGIPEADYASLISGWRSDLNSYVSANRKANESYSSLGLLTNIIYPTGGQTTLAYESNRIVYPDYVAIQNAFLFKSTEAAVIYNGLVGVDTDNGSPSYTTGTFEITGYASVPVKVSAAKDKDPLSFINSAITVSKTPNGIDLLGLYTCQVNTIRCYCDKTIYLDPGTYYYSVTKNVDSEFNAAGGYARLWVGQPANPAINPVPVPMAVGGNRISSITSTDGFGNKIFKRYEYKDSSNNARLSVPFYASASQVRKNVSFGIGSILCADCGQETKLHEESVLPMVGNPITYSSVTEYADSSGANGKTVYQFKYADNLTQDVTKPYVTPFMANWQAGQPLSKKVYKRVGANYQLQLYEQNNYQSTATEGMVWGLKADYYAHCEEPGINNRIINETKENYQTELFYLANSTSYEYDSSGTLQNNSSTTHGTTSHTLPTQIIKYNSHNQVVQTKIKYAWEYDTTNCITAQAIGLRNLRRRNILVPVESIILNTIDGQDYVAGGTLITYQGNQVNPAKVYELELPEPVLLSGFIQSSISSGALVYDSRYKERARFNQYDGFGNALEEQYTNNMPQSYIWNETGDYLVARCANAKQADIGFTSFETGEGTGNFTYVPNVGADANAPGGKMVYGLSAGLSIIHAANPAVTYRIGLWASTNLITVNGAAPAKTRPGSGGWAYYEYTVSNVSNISISGFGNIDEIMLCPADAQMVSYTYTPLVGITTINSGNGNILYYQYDGYGRLQRILDTDKNIVKTIDYRYKANTNE